MTIARESSGRKRAGNNNEVYAPTVTTASGIDVQGRSEASGNG